ncbi:MAG: BMP family ABC transporter substrate-binding protein [Desulfovibrio sp.]|jgi:basic membrane protein A|nr:BMP family ABC transporter substrate-binding protein [Desulfovibrio sp.]
MIFWRSLVFFAFLLAAAPRDGAFFPAQAEAARPDGQALRVALLLDDDDGQAWSTLLRSGLARAEGEFPLRTEVLRASGQSQRTALFRKAAVEFELVLVGSESFHEILRDNAANYRGTMFGCVDAGIRAPNIMCVAFADEQAACLAGAAAAMLTARPGLPGINHEKILGWLTGEETPAQRNLLNGFVEGVRLVDAETRVMNGITGSFSTVGRAGEETRRLLGRGADVIVLAAGEGNSPALEIVRENGGYIIRLDEEGASALPERTLTSIVRRADKAAYEIVAAAASGRFRGKEIIVYNLENRGVDITDVFNGAPALERWPLRDVRRRLEELRREISSGGIGLNHLRARTLCDCL